MKTTIILLLAATLTLSCGNRTNTATNQPDTSIDKHTGPYIRQRISTIYQDVATPAGYTYNRDSAYCSQRYYALMTEAGQLCDKAEEMLYDYDHWIDGQDSSDDWSCSVSRVYEITDTTALVDLNIHNFGDHTTTIALRFERDDWYIDDFTPSADGQDDKHFLRQTIRQCKQILGKAQ